MFVHVFDSDHSLNFKDSQIVFKCNDLHTRKTVKSSLLAKTFQNRTVNLNSGLNCIHPHVDNFSSIATVGNFFE